MLQYVATIVLHPVPWCNPLELFERREWSTLQAHPGGGCGKILKLFIAFRELFFLKKKKTWLESKVEKKKKVSLAIMFFCILLSKYWGFVIRSSMRPKPILIFFPHKARLTGFLSLSFTHNWEYRETEETGSCIFSLCCSDAAAIYSWYARLMLDGCPADTREEGL